MTFRLRPGARATLALLLGFVLQQQFSAASELPVVDHDDGYLYRLPYADEQSYAVIQAWGSPLSHKGREHYAIDFGMPVGTPVHAAREGVVVALEQSHERGCWSGDCVRFANYVAVRHSDGTIGEYLHLHKDGVLVGLGEKVRRGQQIALSGNTGYSNAPHLHFGVYVTTSDGHRRSIDIRFESSGGIVTRPRSGIRYRTAPARLSVSAR
jgi:murein DD-endopeptidase MepM/ murein hydrolase activator NlpD